MYLFVLRYAFQDEEVLTNIAGVICIQLCAEKSSGGLWLCKANQINFTNNKNLIKLSTFFFGGGENNFKLSLQSEKEDS